MARITKKVKILGQIREIPCLFGQDLQHFYGLFYHDAREGTRSVDKISLLSFFVVLGVLRGSISNRVYPVNPAKNFSCLSGFMAKKVHFSVIFFLTAVR